VTQAPAPAYAAQVSTTGAPRADVRGYGAGATAPPGPASESRTRVGLDAGAADLPPSRTATEFRSTGAASNRESDDEIIGTLGGYELIKRLGQGGMGSVYLARQVSLDRNVALKVLSPSLAKDPQFVARFAREAYAAAQLTHHNVVQIHDIGVDRDVNFFSMEFVDGQTLGRLVQDDGKVDPEVAVGYVLQAARGLKFAHDHGLIHRDVKPENLLLNDQGVVKVADLGLVKRANSLEQLTQITPQPWAAVPHSGTQLEVAMGTPAYMPPEQARDAAQVDQRADIYSLGCTLYDLLVGRPPFSGRTAVEVMTKHQSEPVTPPDVLVHRVPKTLSTILLKMVAKRPEDRFQSMGEVIRSLEHFLGIESAGPFTPREEHVKVLESAADRFAASNWGKTRAMFVRAFYVLCLASTLVAAYLRHPIIAGGFVGFAVLTTLFYQITIGVTQKAYLFRRFRQLIFGAGITDWITYVVLVGVIVALLIVFDQWIGWLVFGAAAALLAVAFHSTIDRLVAAERLGPITDVEELLRQMRLRGLDENALRQFVCKYASEAWEEFYEALFGYESKIVARRAWGKTDRGVPRKRFGAWRDPIIGWIDNKMSLRQQTKERKLLAKLEAKALASQGVSSRAAKAKAADSIDSFMDKADTVRRSAQRRMAETALQTAPPAPPVRPLQRPRDSVTPGTAQTSTVPPPVIVQLNWIHDDHVKVAIADHDDTDDDTVRRKHESYLRRRFGTPIDVIFGQLTRLALAAILLCGFGLWWHQSKGQLIKQEAEGTASARRVDASELLKDPSRAFQVARERVDAGVKDYKPLTVPFLPERWSRPLGTYNAGLAGALLLLGYFFRGRVFGLAILISAAIVLVGHDWPLPFIAGKPWLAAAVGGGLGLVAMVFLPDRTD
jgi:hypothetical protein